MVTLELISLVLNLILGGSLIVTLVTLRSTRNEATAKADSAKSQAGKEKVDLVDNTVTTMIETVNKLLEQNQQLIDKYSAKSEETEILKREKTDLEHKFTLLEKKVDRMIKTNLNVIKALETLGVDEEIIRPLRTEPCK